MRIKSTIMVGIVLVLSLQIATSRASDNGLPDGGNYWSDYDTLPEGCNDAKHDGNMRCALFHPLGYPGQIPLDNAG